MITAYLVRTESTDECIRGYFVVDGEVFSTLEPPWRDNECNKSCIVCGKYDTDFMARSASGKYRDVYHLQDVPGRSAILIHKGNLPRHTRGCVLLGKRRGMLGGRRAVLNSATAMAELLEVIGEKSFRLEVMGAQTC